MKNYIAPSFKEEMYSESSCSEDYDEDPFYNYDDTRPLEFNENEEEKQEN